MTLSTVLSIKEFWLFLYFDIYEDNKFHAHVSTITLEQECKILELLHWYDLVE